MIGKGARGDDPFTSHMGDRDAEPRRASQRIRLLEQYRMCEDFGLTSYEASLLSGITNGWRRCSELLRDGAIEVLTNGEDPVTRVNPTTGSKQMVCVITDVGRRELRAYLVSSPLGT